MAEDDDLDADLWTADPSVPSIDVAGGPVGELCGTAGEVSAVLALRIAVDAVRTAVLRRGCPHPGDAGPHCPSCGVRRAEAARWRAPS